MNVHRLLAAALAGFAATAGAQNAPAAHDHAGHQAAAPAPAAAASAALADGEVRKIDRAQGKITLRHGPIRSLDMPPMTMVFRVADAKLLDGLKDGDKIRFSAETANGAITVTSIAPAGR